MLAVTIALAPQARQISRLLRSFFPTDVLTKINNGDPVFYSIILQSAPGNAASIFFGGFSGSQQAVNAEIRPTVATPLLPQVNIQNVYVRGPVGTSIIVILVE